jgi:peptidoglycan/xylan/chitin deacetylase (PgdA/CDA1 family)
MPWKENYTRSDEKSLEDHQVAWPGGHHCAATITVDLSPATTPAGVTEADLQNSPAVFGLHDGTDQVLALLRRFGLKATFTVPAVLARFLADTIRRVQDDGHEIAAGGFKHEDVSGLTRADEAARIALTTEILADATGARPTGWFSLPRAGDPFAVGTISPNTMDLLLEADYAYMGNGLSDDIPHYWVTDFSARRAILTMPYYYHFDDQFFLLFPKKGTGLEHADALYANWVAEFDAQYRRGRYFNMVLHPAAIGWCNRAKLLEDFLAKLHQAPDLWNPTSGECAAYWADAYPAATTLKLEESIWQDYPGSRS